MTSIYQGWTPSYPEHRKLQNALESAMHILADDPGNTYWQNALRHAEQKLLDYYEVQARPAIYEPDAAGVLVPIAAEVAA